MKPIDKLTQEERRKLVLRTEITRRYQRHRRGVRRRLRRVQSNFIDLLSGMAGFVP